MSRPLNVHLLPMLFGPEQLAGGIAVVIDVLRASSTITTALYNEARRVIPSVSVAQARQLRHVAGDDTILLGGERGGVKIEGFDLSNSPADYHHTVVQDRTIVFTTTNGTRALAQCALADKVVIGSFVNLSAVVSFIQSWSHPVHLVCAGTDGRVTGEDVLFAGAIVEQLLVADLSDVSGLPRWELSDCSRIARNEWRQSVQPGRISGSPGEPGPSGHGAVSQAVDAVLLQTQGGRNLQRLGYRNDIRLCSQVDSAPCLPLCTGLAGMQDGAGSTAAICVLQ